MQLMMERVCPYTRMRSSPECTWHKSWLVEQTASDSQLHRSYPPVPSLNSQQLCLMCIISYLFFFLRLRGVIACWGLLSIILSTIPHSAGNNLTIIDITSTSANSASRISSPQGRPQHALANPLLKGVGSIGNYMCIQVGEVLRRRLVNRSR